MRILVLLLALFPLKSFAHEISHEITVEDILRSNIGEHKGHIEKSPEKTCELAVYGKGDWLDDDNYWMKLDFNTSVLFVSLPGAANWIYEASSHTLYFYIDASMKNYIAFDVTPGTLKIKSFFRKTEGDKSLDCQLPFSRSLKNSQ